MSEGKREITVLRPNHDSSIIPPGVECHENGIMIHCVPVPGTVTGTEGISLLFTEYPYNIKAEMKESVIP